MKWDKPSEIEVFEFCGPRHLTTVDWSDSEQRKSVAASLVQGVYVLEGDRQKKRTGDRQLAPMWWEFFHFKCIQTLRDKYDSSFFGAIFEYKRKTPGSSQQAAKAAKYPPKYVVAFRGTILAPKTGVRDIYLDVKILLKDMNNSSRYELAFEATESMLRNEDPKNVWLAGHSLGSSIALHTGRSMAKLGYGIETYLFNPPYASAPIEKFKGRYLKHGARFAKSVVTAGLSIALKRKNKKNNADDDDDNNNNNNHDDDDPFSTLRSWIPCLFVNPKDIICCEYTGYFEHREKMQSWGLGDIEIIASKNSVLNLLAGALGRDTEASYLIPSAFITKNMKNMMIKEDGLLAAHGLSQWWEQHSCWQYKVYQCS